MWTQCTGMWSAGSWCNPNAQRCHSQTQDTIHIYGNVIQRLRICPRYLMRRPRIWSNCTGMSSLDWTCDTNAWVCNLQTGDIDSNLLRWDEYRTLFRLSFTCIILCPQGCCWHTVDVIWCYRNVIWTCRMCSKSMGLLSGDTGCDSNPQGSHLANEDVMLIHGDVICRYSMQSKSVQISSVDAGLDPNSQGCNW